MKKYQIGEKYVVNPHQSDSKWNGEKWVFYNGEMAEFVGYVTFQKIELKDFPVFNFDFFAHNPKNCYMVLYNERCFALGHSIEEMMEDFFRKISYVGKGHDVVMVGSIALPVEEFKEQVKDLLTPQEINESISTGVYYCRCKSRGEVKWCPKCKKIRQTSCSACGCGSCENCNHRWSCMSGASSPFLIENPIDNFRIA